MDLGAIVSDGTGRLRWLWRLGIFGAGMLALLVEISMVGGLGLVVYLTQVDPDALHDPARLETYGELMILAGPVLAGLTLGWVVICRRFLDRRSIVSMGMGPPDPRLENSIGVGFLLGAGPIAVGAGVLALAGAVEFAGPTLTWQLFVFFPLLLIMAFHEELVCRGYFLLLGRLRGTPLVAPASAPPRAAEDAPVGTKTDGPEPAPGA